jgi:hypothetical protein
MAHIRNYAHAFCFMALLAMSTTFLSCHAEETMDIGMCIYFLSFMISALKFGHTFFFCLELYVVLCESGVICADWELGAYCIGQDPGGWIKFCVHDKGCLAPLRPSYHLGCKGYCGGRGYDLDKSDCTPEGSGICCCARSPRKWCMQLITC